MKRLTSLLIVLLMLTALTVPVLAASPKIVDNANLLTDSETAALEAKAQALVDQYQMDIVILTVSSTNGRFIESYADDYYDNNGYGVGPDYSGVLMMLAMDTREWAISTCGDAIYALTDYGIEALFRAMADELSDDEYYTAFDIYLDELPLYFEAFQNGDPIDGYHGGYDGPGTYIPGTQDDIIYYDPEPNAGDYIRIILVSLLIGAAVGGIAILVMRGQMNTATPQSGAASYLHDGSFRLTRHLDLFLYSRVNRTRRQQSSGGGGGGSSVHSSSGGRSHGGGHGRF